MKVKLKWDIAEGEWDTKEMKLKCIEARGTRCFGPDEIDSELCVEDGSYFTIALIHTGDKDSSNALCKEIARRFNEFPDELKK